MKIKKFMPALILSVLLFFVGSCDYNWDNITGSVNDSEPELMYVEISFSENVHLAGYVKTLGLESDVRILVGGSSVNNLYDKHGMVIATFNYAKVNYIKIVPEPME